MMEMKLHRCKNQIECVITVQDTGIGMTREDVEHIFERFYRSDNVRGKNIWTWPWIVSAKLIIMGHTGRIKSVSFTKGTTFINNMNRI